MDNTQVTIDLSYAKNALFIRQSVAVAFGVPIDRELTWGFLKDAICAIDHLAIPKQVTVCGLPSDSGMLGEESRMLMGLLRTIREIHNIKIWIVIND